MTKKNPTSSTMVDEKQINSRLQDCPIAIIGMASVFADTKNLGQFWDTIVQSVNTIKDVPEDRWAIDDYYSADKKAADKTYCKRGGFLPEIDFDPMEFGLPPNILELTDIAQLMSLVVARDVLNDAGIGEGSSYDRDKVGITLGVGGGQKQITALTSRLQAPILDKVLKASGIDDEDRQVIIGKFKKAYIGWEENSFPGMLGNVITGRIANRFDFGGMNCVVDAACAGSLAAMKLAISDLLEHRSEVMISGGVCCDNSPFMYLSFAKTPAFTDSNDIRPFDQDSRGMMIGEGVGMVAFKRLDDAERDGDKIYAVVKGIGTSSDGRFKSIYAPRPDGQVKALKRAYADAGFDPHTCGLIEAHGTGTIAGDDAEFSGLNKYFSEDNKQKQHIALGSVKSQIGHTKSAAGTAGLIKVALALHHKVLPATINVDKPNSNLGIENTPLYINNETRPWMPREDGIKRRAGVSSFGFGGTNFHFVLEEYNANQTTPYRLNVVAQTILVSAANEASLVQQLTDWSDKFNVDIEKQPYIFNALVTKCTLKTPETNLVRCGFIAKNADDAIAMIKQALQQLTAQAGMTEWSTPTGIFYRTSGLESRGKVVALFPGQGSQYINMGRDLACNFPSILATIAEMDSEFTTAGLEQLSGVTYPTPVFSAEDRTQQDIDLRLTQNAQPAIGTFSVALFKTFKQAGFAADFTAGHSFGELTALWAADVLSDSDYMMLARRRGQAMAPPDDKDFDAGTMIAVLGESAKVAEAIKGIKDISIANYNSNNQVVVAGVTSQIDIALTKLTAKGFKVIPLPVSAAFHTPLVAHAQKPFNKAINKAKFNVPKIPVFANGTGKAHSNNAADIKKSLKSHTLESVYFAEEIDNLYLEGGRIFVEFGPKNVLSLLVDNILKDKTDVTTIAVNGNPKKSADEQMRLAAVQMSVLGLKLDNLDPYSAVQRPLKARKLSPLAMKLSGASYVSPKTKKLFEDALTDGWQIKQADAQTQTPKIIEKIVEKEVIVEKIVEKIVYLQADGTPVANQTAPANTDSNADVVHSIERSVGQFVNHQAQLLAVHEEYMKGPQEYAKTFQNVLTSQGNANELPESLDKTLGMYHDFQSETLRVHEAYLNQQTGNMQNMLGAVVPQTSDVPAPVIATPVIDLPQDAVPLVANNENKVIPAVTAVPQPAKQAPMVAIPEAASEAVMTLSQGPTAIDLDKIQAVMLDVVADKTGYPAEMLELDMDMEADLGIDSIKRVEILGAVQEEITDLPELNPEDLAELRTLGEIVDHMKSKVSAATPTTMTTAPLATAVAAPTIDLDKIQAVMLDVVADKTGYPAEMLELSMDMEADLGIDSIKRVEILGAVQEEITDLPELNPEDLAELRTLGEIVDHMKSKVSAATPTTVTTATPSTAVTAPAIDLNKIQAVMLDVVADKTGYPAEMLELSMDMEADLGIDSIKRVEILGAVQEEITDLPELNPEDLAELRTLGEIVDHMKSKVSAAPPTTITTATPSTAVAAPTIDLNKIQAVMLDVVADKTGYPAEMLELSMDMEADLGIDSIKRVEILGAVQEEITDLPELNPEDLAELRTLGEIVDHMKSKVSAATPTTVTTATPATAVAAPTIDLDKIQAVMLDVVADKTGYPAEMLELGMDMEADLGIDSIKRVEILGAVQEEITDLPELNPEDLAELRTLGEIVDHMKSKVSAATPTTVTTATPATAVAAPTIDLDKIQAVMLDVVADKTGYPAEMLELGMDMEADLGIDSIKRVEILGAVQEEITDLPELNPEDLAELRTLGEIVDHMKSKVSAATPTTVTTAPLAIADATPAIDLDKIQAVMLDVVADKTGYPAEMLELGMDMEADLGIDSIKRVEILGAVQEEITDLPELNPEDLAELRTLGEIVNHMKSKVSAEGVSTSLPAATFEPAPSAIVTIKRLSEINTIDLNADATHALIVDDGTGASITLANKLLKSGCKVTALIPRWVKQNSKKTYVKAVNIVELDSLDEVALKQLLTVDFPFTTVIYMHAATTIEEIEYPEESKQGLMLAFVLAKHCNVKEATSTRPTFMVVTRQGGSFGIDNDLNSDLVQGGLSGLVKTLAHEWPMVFCRTVDLTNKLGADKVSGIIIDELSDGDMSYNEIGYDMQGRLTLVGEPTDSCAIEAGDTIGESSVFLVSGGAKGVTAHCVIRLAKQYKSKFILLGRSTYENTEPAWAAGITDEAALKKAAMATLIASGDKPTPVKITKFIKPVLANREIAATIAAIEKVGGQAAYVSANVTDTAGVQKAVQQIIPQFGEVTGLIHGAGVLADNFIEQKSLDDFEAVYSTKIDGLVSMLSCTQHEDLRHLVLFSSAAGFYGNPGQSDYSIANEILNKTAFRFKSLHPKAQVLSFNWGPWDGGMVTPELKRMFHDRGVYVIPLQAGTELFLNEIAADSNRCPQILVGNDMGGKDENEEVAEKKSAISRITKSLAATDNSFFADHVIGGNSVFPSVCAISWMADAVESTYRDYVYLGLENYQLFKGIVFDQDKKDESTQYFIDSKLIDTSNDALKVDVKVSSLNGSATAVFHYGATLLLGRKKASHRPFADELPKLATTQSSEASDLYKNGTLFHGDSLQGIQDIIRCDDKGLLLSCLVADSATEKQGEFPLASHNIFANDLVYQAMLVWVRKHLGVGSLPSTTKAWTVYREVNVNEAFYLVLEVVEQSSNKVLADIKLVDAEKEVLAEIHGAEVTASNSLNELFKN